MHVKDTASCFMSTLVALAFTTTCALSHEPSPGEEQSAVRQEHMQYAYATKGIVEVSNRMKLLLDASNLGGEELEMAEITFVAGSVDGEHKHGSVQ